MVLEREEDGRKRKFKMVTVPLLPSVTEYS